MWLRGRGAASQQRAACDARFGTGGDEGAHVVQVVEASDVERRPELAEVFLDLLGVPLSLGDVPARAAGRALHAGRKDVAGRLSSVSNQACQPGSAGSARRQPRRTRVPAAFVRAGGQAGVEEDRDGEVRPQLVGRLLCEPQLLGRGVGHLDRPGRDAQVGEAGVEEDLQSVREEAVMGQSVSQVKRWGRPPGGTHLPNNVVVEAADRAAGGGEREVVAQVGQVVGVCARAARRTTVGRPTFRAT